MYSTIIDGEVLMRHQNDPDWVIVDCRYDLMDGQAGHDAWKKAHIPAALYANLGTDLCGSPKDPLATGCGRHPMPSAEAMRRTFSRLGIDTGKQVVVYDDASGAFSARLWWMLRFMQHEAVAVLDGGWSAWREIDGAHEAGEESEKSVTEASFTGEPESDRLVLLEQIANVELLVDSRDPDRFYGKLEPIDPVAGHIPGAINHFWQLNLDENGRFLPGEKLAQNFQHLIGKTRPENVVFYCGSGVTACHNLLAFEHAGMQGARLYGGSWSEWCSDPLRPVATGSK